jgi:flagellar biogenesis protein FliO
MEGAQQILGVFFVLALLGGTLWWLRSKGLAQFNLKSRGGSGRQRTLKVTERLPLTPQHSLHLVDVGGRTVLIATSPGGCAILDRLPQSSGEGRPRP